MQTHIYILTYSPVGSSIIRNNYFLSMEALEKYKATKIKDMNLTRRPDGLPNSYNYEDINGKRHIFDTKKVEVTE